MCIGDSKTTAEYNIESARNWKDLRYYSRAHSAASGDEMLYTRYMDTGGRDLGLGFTKIQARLLKKIM